MAEPLTPHWDQPSHPTIQKVIFASKEDEFLTKSVSKIDLPPYALYAKMAFPPCTIAEKATYATVQMGVDEHLNLNSDLVYINHSCDPSLIFDTSSLSILAGPKGLKADNELTFFYPSTEWAMAQGFHCFCNSVHCRGFISGARDMSPVQLEGMWLNAHIRQLLEERETSSSCDSGSGNDMVRKIEVGDGAVGVKESMSGEDETEAALRFSLMQARKMVDAAKKALDMYKSIHGHVKDDGGKEMSGKMRENGVGSRELSGEMGGDTRRGVTSREMSGEMGGDTFVEV